MIARKAVLRSLCCGFIGVALGQAFLASEALALDVAATPPMPEVSEEFRNRAAELGYNLEDLWTAFRQLKSSYESRNISDLWAVSSEPLLLINEDRPVEIKSLSDMAIMNQLIFSNKVRGLILKASFSSLFLNSDGAIIGDGEVWLKKICNDQKCLSSKFLISTIDMIR
jgi:hypothetical protein